MTGAMYLVFDAEGRRLSDGIQVSGEKACAAACDDAFFVFGCSGRAARSERDPSGLMTGVVSLCDRCRFHGYLEGSVIPADAGRARGTAADKILRHSVISPTLLRAVTSAFYADSHGEPARLIARAKEGKRAMCPTWLPPRRRK